MPFALSFRLTKMCPVFSGVPLAERYGDEAENCDTGPLTGVGIGI